MAKSGSKLISIQKDINPFSLVSQFLIMKQDQGITSPTIRSHKSALTNFLAEYKGNIRDCRKLKQAVLLFLADKTNEYYNKLLQALRQFFDFCICEGILKDNPTNGMKYKRHTVRIVEHTEETIKVLIKLPNQETFAGLRDYIFMLTMLDTGIRPNELLQIQINDIDFMNQQMIVREEYSKTSTMRILPLSPHILQLMKKIIHARHEDWDDDIPILCTFSGHRMSSNNMQEKFRDYGNRLGVTITPYHLRHTFALWFIRNGGNVFALQKIMGHTKLDMTRNYIELAKADIKKSHKKATPLQNIFAFSNRVGKMK